VTVHSKGRIAAALLKSTMTKRLRFPLPPATRTDPGQPEPDDRAADEAAMTPNSSWWAERTNRRSRQPSRVMRVASSR
jgi:hypothetical protein